MMKNLFVIVLVFTQLALIAQQPKDLKIKKNKEFTTESGLKLLFYTYNDKAEKVDSADVVEVHYVGKFADGKVFDSSYDRNSPISLGVDQGRVIKGWDEALQYMHLGDSVLVTVPPHLGYGDRDYAAIPGNSTLYFTMKLMSLQKKAKPYDVDGLDTVKMDSGLAFIIVKKGSGKSVQIGDRAKVRYSGYFVNGEKFDSSFDRPGNEPFEFIIGRKQVIDGWEKGVAGMKINERRRLVIPYQMAYGENGRNPVIPPKADLIFDVELVDFETVVPPLVYDVSGKDTMTTASGLRYIKVKTTNGRQVMAGDTITATYTGYFVDGTIFDSSVERRDSIVLVVGRGMVIKGWDEGLQLLKEGEKVKLIIPYYLAYGENGRPPVIPPKAELVFDVYLKKIGL